MQQYHDAVDGQARAMAVTAVARFEDVKADAVLMAAAIDADATVRYKAIEVLWRKAADSDPESRMQALLQQAVFDHDAKVADLAGRAVADLQQLAQGTIQPGR